MKLWGIEWPEGWHSWYGGGDCGTYTTYVTRDRDQLPWVEVHRYRAAMVRRKRLHGEYRAVAVRAPDGDFIKRTLGVFETPNEALAACLFYDGRW